MGGAVAKVAAMIGKPLMPWQQHVADVAMEVDQATGKLVYGEVDLTVTRQSGKTTLELAIAVHRGLATRQFGPRNHIIYTAQTRKDARDKWLEGFLEDLKASQALRGKFTYKLAPGSEHVRFTNGSRFGIEATTEKSGHGPTLDLAFVDEAFSQVDDRTEQAFEPAMLTRDQAQLWVSSTAGWLGGSPYLWEKVKRGRDLAESGDTDSGVCYFEWSAPEDADPGDPEVWRGCMPALGITISESAIRTRYRKTQEVNKFKRPYLNIWVPKDAPAEQVIPAEVWAASQDRTSIPDPPLAFAFDMNPERSHGSIGVAAHSGDRVHVEVTDDHGGTEWMINRIVELDAMDPCIWVVDGRSPAASLVPFLADKGIEVRVTTAQDMARACGSFYDMATRKDHAGLVHLGQPELAAALAGAMKRSIGDAWGWDRRGETVIAPLVAVTLAAYGLTIADEPPGPVALPSISRPSARSDVTTLRW